MRGGANRGTFNLTMFDHQGIFYLEVYSTLFFHLWIQNDTLNVIRYIHCTQHLLASSLAIYLDEHVGTSLWMEIIRVLETWIHLMHRKVFTPVLILKF